MSKSRNGKNKLLWLAESTNERDRKTLESLREFRYMSTEQIRRLRFVAIDTKSKASRLATLRATTRCLFRLRGLGLITFLARRVGGVRAGSGSFVWSLSGIGARLLAHLNGETARFRFVEPSANFLAHTLAVVEVMLTLLEICRSNGLELVARENEPECWRSYTGLAGKTLWLRPDLYALTSGGEYEDAWFFEVDLATESPAAVVRKCEQYQKYMRSGVEQKQSGVFPCVVWMVPDEKRKCVLKQYIGERLSNKNENLFVVITMVELERLVTSGADEFGKGGK